MRLRYGSQALVEPVGTLAGFVPAEPVGTVAGFGLWRGS